MEDLKIQISGHPQEPNIDRFLIVNTVVHKRRETPQYAKIIFDLVYEKAGVPMKDMDNRMREFVVSNANYVDRATGMRLYIDGVENDVPYMLNEDGDKVPILNTAKQYDFFKTLVNNKIKTEDELIAQYVALMDSVNFFD